MSHNWNCPSDWEAREKARRDASFDHDYGWGESYRHPYECDEANAEYRRAYSSEYHYREEEASEERRAERAKQARRDEEAYYEQVYAEQAQQLEAAARAHWEEQERNAIQDADNG